MKRKDDNTARSEQISRAEYYHRQKKKLFPKLDKRIGKDLIVAYSEVKELSGLNDKEFFQIFNSWLHYTTAKM